MTLREMRLYGGGAKASVYVAECIGFQTYLATMGMNGCSWFRCPPVADARNNQDVRRCRNAVARTLRKLLRNGVGTPQLREIVAGIIDAPESYAGRLRADACDTARKQILSLIVAVENAHAG